MQSPEYFARLGAADEQTVHLAVEELLRYLTVVQVAFPRFSRTEVEIGGQQIPAGALVLVSLSGGGSGRGAGRAVVPPDMERFDPTRPATLAPGVRVRHSPLRRRRAGPDGAADRLPRAGPPVPDPAARRADRRSLAFRNSSIVYSAETCRSSGGSGTDQSANAAKLEHRRTSPSEARMSARYLPDLPGASSAPTIRSASTRPPTARRALGHARSAGGHPDHPRPQERRAPQGCR